MVDMWTGIREGEQLGGYPPAVSEMLFVINISISLGMLNLLPIPALDGGRILFALPEIILRRRIPPHLENVINFVSFALLIVLLIVINLNDFINPQTFP
jgi:regulator of sigma E protease